MSVFVIIAALVSGPDLLISANRALVGYALRHDQPLTAERLLYFSLRLQPASAELRELYGQVFYARGDFAAATDQFQLAVESNPDFAAARNNLGVSLLRIGLANQALPHLEAAAALDPTSALALVNLGNAYQATGQNSRAASAYQRAVNLNPDLGAAWVAWGGVQLEGGDLAAANQAFEKAVSFQADDALALKGLGAIAVLQQRPLNSLPYLQAASQASPRDAVIHVFLGLALEQLGRPEQALAEFQQAYVLSSDDTLRDEINLHLMQLILQLGTEPSQ
jgi:tetratricopeptide (TPR) repeat protein